jgi:pilus assembly protein FimV
MNFQRFLAGIPGVKMFLKLPRPVLMACLLCPSLAWGLGLGDIHLESALNEPLRAEIDLVAATPEELAGLRATLAANDAFTRYGIDRPSFLSSLVFKVGKNKDKREVLLVTSTQSIPEPFVTFLVEVNWSRGRLLREYTLLLDPPVYSPGETEVAAAPVAAPVTTPVTAAKSRAKAPAASEQAVQTMPAPPRPVTETQPLPEAKPPLAIGSEGYRVKTGDTLSKIAASLNGGTKAQVDQTMIAVFRDNPLAFDRNINVLRKGAILRLPGADEIAALNQREAISEVNRQMSAWRNGAETPASAPAGRLRLVTPTERGGNGTGDAAHARAAAGSTGAGGANSESLALKDRVKDLESQLAESHRLLDLKNAELSDLQHKLGAKAPPPPVSPPASVLAPVGVSPAAGKPTAPVTSAPATAPPAASTAIESSAPATPAPVATPAPKPVHKKPVVVPVPVAEESWLDWLTSNWWIPAAVLVAVLAGLGLAVFKRRQKSQIGEFAAMAAATDVAASSTTEKILGIRKSDDSFVVEESGEHRVPDFAAAAPEAPRAADEALSAQSPVNIDQGDPLAEADFHMAYGLYDQAADLVRIALEREPDRRDLRLKLLEIYFVWGNKDAFLQTAKSLEASKDRAPAGEWDKIVIMGKQICPEESMFNQKTGGGRGAGALVDMNLEGGENRIDIDLFGEPEGEQGLDHGLAKEHDDTVETGESPSLKNVAGLDFMLDTPERGADESPTRQMPAHDEPTVESELMEFHETPTQVSPAVSPAALRGRIENKLSSGDQTAEVAIDDLGLDLDGLDDSSANSAKLNALEETGHPDDAPTMVAGLDERSRRMMTEAESRSRDNDLTELERELEASFIADLDPNFDDLKAGAMAPESAATVQMRTDSAATARFPTAKLGESPAAERDDLDSTSKLRGINPDDSVDLDLDRLAQALGGTGDTVDQPRAAEDVFSTEVFEASRRSRRIDLDLGEGLNGSDAATPTGGGLNGSSRLEDTDHGMPEFEPVTMSEVGTKLDLARAYMDMGDPEGARNILDEVVQEGSVSQKQEAQRLIQALPG